MVQLLVHHKWLIRAGLALFWTAEIIAFAFNRGFITYMLEKHTWWTLLIVFLTFKYLIEPFYAPFLKLKKEGGEAVMEKSTKILLVLAAALGALVVAMGIEQSRVVIVNGFKQGVLNPIYAMGVRINSWLGTYPALWILGSGLLSGLILAVFIKYIAAPKIRYKVPSISPKIPFRAQREPAEPEYAPIRNPKSKTVKETSASPEVEETSKTVESE